jgi:hypothetical protein
MKRTLTVGLIHLCALMTFQIQAARADEIPQAYRECINKGLQWLAKVQDRDGHWEAPGGSYPVSMTGLSGIALLMEGSTLREGKYADNLRRATDWLTNCTQRNGLISPLNGMGRGYMHDHGYALLFLAQVYGEEEDGERRKHLEDLLTRAVDFTGKAQTRSGGWGYVSAADSGGSDEGSVTITQVQALRACRNAGIAVPKGIIERAQKYLKDCTAGDGGVIYSPANRAGGGRPALTAAAIACAFSTGDYNSTQVKTWFRYCKHSIPLLGNGRMGHDEYTQYYWSQSVYFIGDEGWAKLFPESAPEDRITWTKYRKNTFDFLRQQQNNDGSWSGSGMWGQIGPVYATSMALTIMQLDKATLPIYQR